jgi:secretion/DNA translocation related TadE-like protein
MRRDERGAGTVLTIGIAAALFAVACAVAVLVGWFASIRHAEQVAELAALAGASAAVQGESPCEGAESAAGHNHTALTRCVVRGTGADVVVEVGVTVELVPTLRFGPERVERVATAGTT